MKVETQPNQELNFVRFSNRIFICSSYCNCLFHDFLSFDKTRVCRIYFTTYLSQNRMFSLLFLQNFLRILIFETSILSLLSSQLGSAVCSARITVCARYLNFDEICLDLSGTMCTKNLRSKFMSKTLIFVFYFRYF